ncbi:secreted Ly-6/uPAR domain-containing protein 2 [Manis pentadactyla]|uniref:secreted Ly-6/uPAR domain-containing protein 2 n=1 Tax=Manis pentadactyla TaxID=143292 RepID=UPI00255C299A|nr:secreted Ly-6/uPAR domain-containing protein 2 [Manis pentadactyla]
MQEVPQLCPVSSFCPSASATAQALRCHQGQGFGGCFHKSTCLPGSSHCVTIATCESGTCRVGWPAEETLAWRGQSLIQMPSKSGGEQGQRPPPQSRREPEQGGGGQTSAWWLGVGDAGSSKPQGTCRAFLLSTPGVHSSFKDLPLVTKMCYSGCPDISTLGLVPNTSIACCHASLCSHD